MKYINVVIDENGTSTIEAEGFKGGSCQAHVDAFAQGSKITKRTLKPEFHQQEVKGKEKVKVGQ